MNTTLAAFVVANEYGNYVGIVGAVLRSHVTSGPQFVLPTAHCAPCFDLKHAQGLLLMLGNQIVDETQREIKFYMDPLPSRPFVAGVVPVVEIKEIEKAQGARSFS